MASCNKCGAEIKFVKTGDFKPDGKPKYLVRNMDGSQHVCGKVEPVKDLGPARQGILISVVKSDRKPVSVVIRTDAKGDRTYAVHPTVNLCSDDELPQRVNFSVDKTRFATIYAYLGPAELQPTIGDFKTAAQVKSETHKPAEPELNTPADYHKGAPLVKKQEAQKGGAPGTTVAEVAEIMQTVGPAIKEAMESPPYEKARHYGALTGIQKDKLIVLQSNFRTICELVGASGGGLSFDLIWEKTVEITNKMLVEAVKE